MSIDFNKSLNNILNLKSIKLLFIFTLLKLFAECFCNFEDSSKDINVLDFFITRIDFLFVLADVPLNKDIVIPFMDEANPIGLGLPLSVEESRDLHIRQFHLIYSVGVGELH